MDKKKLIIDDISEIAAEIIKFTDDTENEVAVVGYYETICELLNYLIKKTDSEFVSGELHPQEWDDYEDAYCLEYDKEEIWVSKMCYEDDKYELPYGDIVYVEEDFWDKYTAEFGKNNAKQFGFSDVNEKEDEDSDGVKICMDDDECGFCFCIDDDNNHTKFKYRGNKKLSQEQIAQIINNYLF